MGEIVFNNDVLFQRIAALIEESRQQVKTTINTAMVYTYYNIGRYIIEEEQQGKQRAEYGKAILKDLSTRLTKQFGKGWTVENLTLIRKFYVAYSNSVNTVYEINDSDSVKKLNTVYPIQPTFTLSWSHYLILMRVNNPDARSFYEIECKQQDWSVRQLSRQVGSSLYERLALSRNKDEVMRLAREGQTNIYASAYELYLPNKELLQAKVKEWIAEFEENKQE